MSTTREEREARRELSARRYADGMFVDEIAALTGVSLNTVRVDLRRMGVKLTRRRSSGSLSPAQVQAIAARRELVAKCHTEGMFVDEIAGATAMSTSTIRDDLMSFLIDARRRGKRVVGYGAPGKGNTLLNYCGIRPDLLEYTVDRNPYKHGRLTPGTRIPIHEPERIAADKPDYVLILPWNLRTELTEQLSFVHEWGGKLVFPIPALEVV